MTDSTTDKIEGKLHQAKGRIKEAVGALAGDSDLKVEGQTENLSGKIQEKIGDIKKVFDK